MIGIIGGGAIAERGILPVIPGRVLDCDVRDYGSIVRALTDGGIWKLVYTAGVSYPGPVGQEFKHEIDVNLIGAFRFAQAAVELFEDPELVFIASVAGMYGKPNHSGYSASKAGVVSLMQSLAMEGIKAYAVSPGRVDTPMRERDYPDEDVRTRLRPLQVGDIVKRAFDGEYEPGSNVIIRKIGFETHCFVDHGEPWKKWLRVGEPPRC